MVSTNSRLMTSPMDTGKVNTDGPPDPPEKSNGLADVSGSLVLITPPVMGDPLKKMVHGMIAVKWSKLWAKANGPESSCQSQVASFCSRTITDLF